MISCRLTIVTIAACMAVLMGCSGGYDEKLLIGTWDRDLKGVSNATLYQSRTFTADGQYSQSRMQQFGSSSSSGKYELNGSEIRLMRTPEHGEEDFEYTLRIVTLSRNRLVLETTDKEPIQMKYKREKKKDSQSFGL